MMFGAPVNVSLELEKCRRGKKREEKAKIHVKKKSNYPYLKKI